MRKVSAQELLQLVADGGHVLQQDPDESKVVDLAGLIEAIGSIPAVDLQDLVKAVRGIEVKIDVPAPKVIVQPAPLTSWMFKIERDGRGQVANVIADPINS